MATAWLLLLGLAPFTASPQAEFEWSRAFVEAASSGVWDWRHGLAAFWCAWFWQIWAGGRSHSRALASSLALVGLLLLAAGLTAAQSLFSPLWTGPFGWHGHFVGIALGALAALVAGKAMHMQLAAHSLRSVWRGVYGVCAVLALLTMAPPSDGSGWLAALFDHFYQFIKAAIVWLPFGGLLGLLGLGLLARVWTLAGLLTLLLVGHVDLMHLPSQDWLEIFAVAPSLALGLWMGDSTRRQSGWQVDAAATVAKADAQPFVVTAAPARRDAPPAPIERLRESSLAEAPQGSPLIYLQKPLDWAAGLLLAVAVAGVLVGFPFAAWQLGLGLAAYALLLWRQPLAWLLVVPVALPVLDLAPWSGRFFLDEFDLLLMVTLAMTILRGRPLPALSWPPLARLTMVVWFGLALISGVIGLMALPALDANAFTNYWSAYNSLRVAKGFLWGAVLLFLIRRSCDDLQRFTRWLAIGMGLGLLAVCLVGIWERWLYSGLTDLEATYRIVGLFSSMHTGGGHIEAYMAAALPFLWLGLRHWKTLPLVAALLALATYVLIYTVSRGGALAFGLMFIILSIASARMAWLSGKRPVQFAPILVLAGAATILLAGIGGGYFQQRFSQTAEDAQTRLTHWSDSLAMTDAGWGTAMFGMGLGSFPRVFLERGAIEDRPGTYGFVASRTGQALRLGTGATLYYAQRAAIQPVTTYRLLIDARAEGQTTRIDTPICEKQMLNSRRCVWSSFEVPGDGVWRRYQREINSGELGGGGPLGHLPTEFVLGNLGKGGLLEIDNVQLLDGDGQNLLCNGNFEAAGDCWFFKTHSHLPWHIKNVWVHVVFEQGWLGLAAFLALTVLALARTAKAAWRGQALAWVLLASLVGMLSIGVFDSLLDTPRLAMLLLGISLMAAAPPWMARQNPARKRKRRVRGA